MDVCDKSTMQISDYNVCDDSRWGIGCCFTDRGISTRPRRHHDVEGRRRDLNHVLLGRLVQQSQPRPHAMERCCYSNRVLVGRGVRRRRIDQIVERSLNGRERCPHCAFGTVYVTGYHGCITRSDLRPRGACGAIAAIRTAWVAAAIRMPSS